MCFGQHVQADLCPGQGIISEQGSQAYRLTPELQSVLHVDAYGRYRCKQAHSEPFMAQAKQTHWSQRTDTVEICM